jgi:hypothetical protein
LDGSNLRWEWDRKFGGWYRQGTRHQLFDKFHPEFGDAIELFMDTLALPLQNRILNEGWPSVVVFTEYWGISSFAGKHDPEDPKNLTIIDISPYKMEMLPPERFLEFTKDLPTPKYFGLMDWNYNFRRSIYDSRLYGVTFEGVVGKYSYGRNRVDMLKLKSKAWLDRVRIEFSEKEANEILRS